MKYADFRQIMRSLSAKAVASHQYLEARALRLLDDLLLEVRDVRVLGVTLSALLTKGSGYAVLEDPQLAFRL